MYNKIVLDKIIQVRWDLNKIACTDFRLDE